jgi:hypothetical protein
MIFGSHQSIAGGPFQCLDQGQGATCNRMDLEDDKQNLKMLRSLMKKPDKKSSKS